jgi:ribonuclease HI
VPTNEKSVTIYTDGACSGNPGPGGYGVVLMYNKYRKELSGGYKKTTNNRMELMAVIKGLEALKTSCNVDVYSDSQYVVNAVQKGWLKKWSKSNWMRNKTDKVLNVDLWKQLIELLKIHNVEFHWVRGHSDNVENERCDQLAVQAAKSDKLEEDIMAAI